MDLYRYYVDTYGLVYETRAAAETTLPGYDGSLELHARTGGFVIRTAVRGLGELFITAGLVVLLFVTYQLVWTNFEAHRAADQVADDIRDDWTRPPRRHDRQPGRDAGHDRQGLRVPAHPPARRRWSVPVVEGVELPDLARGVGHYPETARPGQVGNFAVAGHRATNGEPFAGLDQLHKGDVVVAETRGRLVHLCRGPDPDRDAGRHLGPRPGARQAERDPHPTAADAHDVQPALGVVRAADRLRPPAGEPVEGGRAASGARPRGRGRLMYAWIWRHLPGPWPVRGLLAALLAAAVVVLLFTTVFPWAEHTLPFLDVTVDQ